jgi:hypothetical protein
MRTVRGIIDRTYKIDTLEDRKQDIGIEKGSNPETENCV